LPICFSLEQIIFNKSSNRTFYALGEPNQKYQVKADVYEELTGLKEEPSYLV